MPQEGVTERVAASTITTALLARPRLVAFLLVLTASIALQGAAAGEITAGNSDFNTTDNGPDS